MHIKKLPLLLVLSPTRLAYAESLLAHRVVHHALAGFAEGVASHSCGLALGISLLPHRDGGHTGTFRNLVAEPLAAMPRPAAAPL